MGCHPQLQQIKTFPPALEKQRLTAKFRAANSRKTMQRLRLAREHGFESWGGSGAPITSPFFRAQPWEPFMQAFRALKAGDTAQYRNRAAPGPRTLLNARGTNGNTLLT
jgi:hypothetical protein